jgi:hypothetical protein
MANGCGGAGGGGWMAGSSDAADDEEKGCETAMVTRYQKGERTKTNRCVKRFEVRALAAMKRATRRRSTTRAAT